MYQQREREPWYSVNMTLPEHILGFLAEIDPDRTLAVVKAAVGVRGFRETTIR